MTDHLDLDDEFDTGDETDQSEALETSTSEFYNAFEVKNVLGHGLASTVRLCIEKGTGLEFAVKIVDISTERQSEVEAHRLYNETISEVNLLRQLSEHPSIINIHDFYETPAFLFAVFEMAPKGELFDVLNKSVTVSEKKARRLMRQLFDGVAYMHDRNIVHRDIKLENILCIDDERIVISDFGFATQIQPGQKLRELLGTPGYLAPEMLKCQMYEEADGYSVEVDDWALGLMMLRMIQEAKYEFRADQWSQITYDAKDLISHLLIVEVQQRLTAAQCLHHPWMKTAAVTLKKSVIQQKLIIEKRDYKKLWKYSITMARFFVRLTNIKVLKLLVDRDVLRERPFRDRDAAVFEVYGHWVNRGFYYSRDMLFANKPKPKYRKMEIEAS
uniref:phosphorylase kinase n=1 Tax=Wuchereria bancrofti TaxID=6293 RepID=A0A1I8EAE4_WUCBA